MPWYSTYRTVAHGHTTCTYAKTRVCARTAQECARASARGIKIIGTIIYRSALHPQPDHGSGLLNGFLVFCEPEFRILFDEVLLRGGESSSPAQRQGTKVPTQARNLILQGF